MLVEDGNPEKFEEGHYRIQHADATPENRRSAENFLQLQGCTRIVHYKQHAIDSDRMPLLSIGHVEPLAVVQQRARQPRHD